MSYPAALPAPALPSPTPRFLRLTGGLAALATLPLAFTEALPALQSALPGDMHAQLASGPGGGPGIAGDPSAASPGHQVGGTAAGPIGAPAASGLATVASAGHLDTAPGLPTATSPISGAQLAGAAFAAEPQRAALGPAATTAAGGAATARTTASQDSSPAATGEEAESDRDVRAEAPGGRVESTGRDADAGTAAAREHPWPPRS